MNSVDKGTYFSQYFFTLFNLDLGQYFKEWNRSTVSICSDSKRLLGIKVLKQQWRWSWSLRYSPWYVWEVQFCLTFDLVCSIVPADLGRGPAAMSLAIEGHVSSFVVRPQDRGVAQRGPFRRDDPHRLRNNWKRNLSNHCQSPNFLIGREPHIYSGREGGGASKIPNSNKGWVRDPRLFRELYTSSSVLFDASSTQRGDRLHPYSTGSRGVMRARWMKTKRRAENV